MAKKLLGLATMERLLKQAGAERVSESAKAALKDVLEAVAAKLGGEAVEFSKHAGRRTVMGDDIKLAAKKHSAGATLPP